MKFVGPHGNVLTLLAWYLLVLKKSNAYQALEGLSLHAVPCFTSNVRITIAVFISQE